MIPFMATQSLVMGHAFGEAFQYGKRKISAMSNEEFNKLKLEDLAANMFKSYSIIIPDLQKSIGNSTDLQTFIVKELLNLPIEIIKGLFGDSGESTPRKTIPTVPEEEREVPTRAGPKKIPQKDVQFKNFRFTISYDETKRRGVTPTHTQVIAKAREWFKASHPDDIHTVTKLTITQKENYSNKWWYTVTLFLNMPLRKVH